MPSNRYPLREFTCFSTLLGFYTRQTATAVSNGSTNDQFSIVSYFVWSQSEDSLFYDRHVTSPTARSHSLLHLIVVLLLVILIVGLIFRFC